MLFSQQKNILIHCLYIVLLLVTLRIDPNTSFVIPNILLSIPLGIYSNTNMGRKMKYKYDIGTADELKSLYYVILILIVPYVVTEFPSSDIQMLKGIMYNLNMFISVIAIGYTFPTDTRIVDIFTSNFVIMILIVNILIFSINSMIISIVASWIIFIIANIILIINLQRKKCL